MDDRKLGILLLVISLVLLGIVFYINVNNSFSSLANPLTGEGLGNLCSSEEDCKEFCNDNSGRCNDYCGENPFNILCDTLFKN